MQSNGEIIGLDQGMCSQEPPHLTSDWLIMLVSERESCAPFISLADKRVHLTAMGISKVFFFNIFFERELLFFSRIPALHAGNPAQFSPCTKSESPRTRENYKKAQFGCNSHVFGKRGKIVFFS